MLSIRRLTLLLGCLLLVVPTGVASAQSSIEIDAVTGVDGWIDSRLPFDIVVTVSSDVLFDGSIEATMGSIVVATAAQVPAGSTKVFEITMPPPNTSGGIRIDMMTASGERVETVRVTPRYPIDEVMVGVPRGSNVSGLDGLRTPVVDSEIVVVQMDPDTGFGLLDYLVTPDAGEAELEYVRRGGVVIAESAVANEATQVSTQPDRFRLGSGELVLVPSVTDIEAYSDLLISRGRRSGPLEFWQSPDQGLSEAATNAGDGGIPEIPWLFGAIVGYTVLIGPINFLILRRLRRRDWAWLTIPAISVSALFVFWLVGAQRLSDATVTHASLIVAGDEPMERSSVVLAVGGEGSYTLGFDTAEIVYPATLGNRFDEFGRPVATAPGEIVGSDIRFDLQQLGFAGAHAIGTPTLPVMEVDWSQLDEDRVTVDNPSQVGYWAWGVWESGSITVAPDPLPAGGSASLNLRAGNDGQFFEPEFGFFLGDAVINQMGLFDERGWRVITPLGNAAQHAIGETPQRFVFGFSEDYQPAVTLGGSPVNSQGNLLVLVPDTAVDLGGSESGTLLAIGSGFVEPSGGPGFSFVSTDEMWLGYRLPVGVDNAVLEFENRFGGNPPGQQLWDWQAEELVDIEIGMEVDARFIDPGGNVLLRVGVNKQEFEGGFVELQMSPRTYTLEWGS